MTERGFGIRADAHKAAWESEDFPQLCESCLGDNPYVRMMKESFGQACKICNRPFTVFRWKPGKRARYKKTEICQSCARMKNVCQTCVLDLQFHLPVQVRDAFVTNDEDKARLQVPESDANREWFAQQHNRRLEQEGAVSAFSGSNGGSSGANKALLQIARTEPYYKRNRPHLCSFFARGECTRGDECPYLHEMPRDASDPMAKQNIRDRFYGKNDPVAERMLGKQKHKPQQGTSHGKGPMNKGRKVPPPPPPPPAPRPAGAASAGASDSKAKVKVKAKPPPPPGPPPPTAAATTSKQEVKD